MPTPEQQQQQLSQSRRRASLSFLCTPLTCTVVLAFSAGLMFGAGHTVRRGLEWHHSARMDHLYRHWQLERQQQQQQPTDESAREAARRALIDEYTELALQRIHNESSGGGDDDDSDAITLYVVTGPESSGHHAVVQLLASTGKCDAGDTSAVDWHGTSVQLLDRVRYDAEWVDRLDMATLERRVRDAPTRRCFVAFRSLPHADRMPSFRTLAHYAHTDSAALGMRVRVRFLLVVRADPLVAHSQLEHGHARTLTQAYHKIRAAQRHLLSELGTLIAVRRTDVWVRLVHYSDLHRVEYARWLLHECGLHGGGDGSSIDANRDAARWARLQ